MNPLVSFSLDVDEFKSPSQTDTSMSTNPDNEAQTAPSSSQDQPKASVESIRLPTIEEVRCQDIGTIVLFAVLSVELWSAGGGLGLFMGLFLGALDNPIMQDEMTGRQQLIYQATQMGRRSWNSCPGQA